MKDIKVSEQFPAIQGEGFTLGKPVYFVRLSGCNTQCPWCDSKYHTDGSYMLIGDLKNDILKSNLERVVLTGGEPMIQKERVFDLIDMLPNIKFDIETNGSIYDERMKKFTTINCSPKVQQIQYDENGKLINSSYSQIAELPNSYFKFVYDRQNGKWWERFVDAIGITKDRVWIMPEGASRDEQIEKMTEVIEYCLANKYNFSPRVQVLAYNTKRGV